MSNDSKNITWPGWETVRLIGHGSFGTVYEIQRFMAGEQEKAALKVITIPKDESEIALRRHKNYTDADITAYFTDYKGKFEREYAMMVKMKGHANIVYCDDIRTVQHDDGFGWDIYIKMELLEPLKERIKSGLSEEEIIKLGKDICNALVYCEKMDVVHRDIKPDNIFVSKTGEYKLGDFGIAKTMDGTATGTVTGTPEYMAPEVTNIHCYSNKADIYSLGMTLYYLLNEQTGPFLTVGKRPTYSEETAAKDKRFAGTPIPTPKYGSNELKAIVLKACAYDPKDRYQSAEEMLDALNSLNGKSNGITHMTTVHKGFALSETVGSDYIGKHTAKVYSTDINDEYGGTVGPEFYGVNAVEINISNDTHGGTVYPVIEKKKNGQFTKENKSTIIACLIALLAIAITFAIIGWKKTKPPVVTSNPEIIQALPIPSARDLDDIGSPITKPKASSYLPQHMYGYVNAPKGDSVYGYYYSDAKGTNGIYFYPDHGERVTVLAIENGRACVIVQSNQKACWINKDYIYYS